MNKLTERGKEGAVEKAKINRKKKVPETTNSSLHTFKYEERSKKPLILQRIYAGLSN